MEVMIDQLVGHLTLLAKFDDVVGIPLDGTSVNPARSFGPALFAGGDAMGQVWLFIVAPLIGALVAVIAWKLIKSNDEMPEKLVAGAERE